MQKFLLIVSVIVFFSCQKKGKHEFNYHCTVNAYSYMLEAYSTDTTYQEMLEVKRQHKSVMVLDRTIHQDSLNDGEWYFHSGYPSIFKIKFAPDSLYIYTWNGSQGGDSSKSYQCQEK